MQNKVREMKNLDIHVEMKDIQRAYQSLASKVTQTPLAYSRNCTKIAKTSVFLKQENHQITGSFKIRGAMNKALSLTEEERARGVIACSAGNHAQGVAYSANYVGAKSTVVMPVNTPLVKSMATRSYGAEVLFYGSVYDESYEMAEALAKKEKYTFIHPFEDPHVIAGQGSMGLEILDQMEELDSILIPIGGGGLISGVSMAIKESLPHCRVIGVVPKNCSAMQALFKSQYTKDFKYTASIADGTSVKEPSELMYNHFIKKYVDDIFSVDEETIASAMVYLLERAKTVVEGSGALALGALMLHTENLNLGDKTCLILSGGNVDMNIISQVTERGLAKVGRIARISVIVPDCPGSLSELTNVIANRRGNVLEVHHDRLGTSINLQQTKIEFLLETRGFDHLNEILEALKEMGALVENNN